MLFTTTYAYSTCKKVVYHTPLTERRRVLISLFKVLSRKVENH